jgi:hypothetical protein
MTARNRSYHSSSVPVAEAVMMVRIRFVISFIAEAFSGVAIEVVKRTMLKIVKVRIR